MNLSQRHPIIVVGTVIDIVFLLAATAVIETPVLVVVVVPGSNVIPLPLPVPGLTIEKWMSTGDWRRGFVSALSLILAGLHHQEIKRIFARVGEQPYPDGIVCIKNMSSEWGTGSDGRRRNGQARCPLPPIRYRGYWIGSSTCCRLSTPSTDCKFGDPKTPNAIPPPKCSSYQG